MKFRLLALTLLAALGTSGALAADSSEQTQDLELHKAIGAERTAPVTPFRINIDLRSLPQPKEWKPGEPVREVPRRFYPTPGTWQEPIIDEQPDALAAIQNDFQAQQQRGVESFTNPTNNFAGIGFTGANPPDTVGDVSPEHYIQAVNGGGTRVRIWDKAGPSVITTFTLENLAGTVSCSNGLGDPIVLWDRQAQRWMIAEFSSSGNNLCVYVSQTSDPVSGGWFSYGFTAPAFPDYPKFGVWPTDANGGDGSYVVTANDGGPPGVYAMDRGAMLAGNAATMQIRSIPSLSGFGFQAPTPADLDGPDAPASGSPALIMRHRDTEVHGGGGGSGDLLELWYFDVDWENAGSTTLIQQPSISVADFSSSLCGLTSFFCFPQPGSGTTLDPLREVIMNRLQYINHASDGYETLTGNFVVDTNGADLGGLRWFELRRTGGGGWLLEQEGTYVPDSDSRWMAGSSMDQSGNIAIAYNVSSSSTFPSLRYTGRLATDPPGVMTAPETSIAAGSSPNSSNRYGDYGSMNLDPADDCTFWFTSLYNPSSNWATRIASFKFESCGCLLEPTAPTLTAVGIDENKIELSWNDADLDTVIEYVVQRSRTAGGPYETIATIEDNNPGVAGGPGYTFLDDTVSGSIEYFYTVIASDGTACRSDAVNEVSEIVGGACLLRPQFDGLLDANIAVQGTCGVTVNWTPASAECGTDVRYNLYRSTDPNFTPGPATLVAGGIEGTQVIDENSLISGQEYTYLVRAIDLSNFVEDTNDVKSTVVAGGAGGAQAVLFEDFSNAASFENWSVLTFGNHRCGEFERSSSATQRPSGGSGQYALALSQSCTQLLPLTNTALDSPVVDLSSPVIAAVTLEYDLFYNHFSGDDATVQVWDGTQWVVIWADTNQDVNQKFSFDVTAYAGPDFQVRFSYLNANDDRWYAVDNVRIGVDLVCDTGISPNPVPNGALSSQALTASRLDNNGDSLQVNWDASSCPATEYNLLYGDLNSLLTYDLLGSECDLGGSGSFNWSGVPAGDLFYLIVGADGSGTESSWGSASFGERNGLDASGTCGTSVKNVAGSCPAE